MPGFDDWDTTATDPASAGPVDEGGTKLAASGVLRLSPAPAMAAAGMLTLSIILYGGQRLGIAAFSPVWLSGVGYLMTPLGVIGCLSWALALDSKLRLSPWYDRSTTKLMLVKVLAGTALIVGFAHMWTIATYFARIFAGGNS